MSPLTFYNSLTRKKDLFTPLNPSCIGLYVCGPTVYDFAHIGNARPAVVFDVLVRILRFFYPKVIYVRNITDVDDKINEASLKSGESIQTITERTTKAYHEDMKAIGVLPPDIEPRATDHIQEMIEMTKILIDKGFAYIREDHVLFNVTQFPSYGHLSQQNIEETLAGARIDVPFYKINPGDFVLWKPSPLPFPGWESPWGRGRPGWHIECSAMGGKYLGKTFDIHGGGIDLIFPHHENELAQSCCAHGTLKLANYWLHNGHVTVCGEKMSKSLGNFLTVRDLRHQHDGETLRFALLLSHYRQPLDWSDSHLTQAKKTLDRFYNSLRGIHFSSHPLTEIKPDNRVMGALADDLNIPLALSYLHEMANEIYKSNSSDEKLEKINVLKATAWFLGILQQDPEVWFQKNVTDAINILTIETLIEDRHQARLNKEFDRSDSIRQQLLREGILLEDTDKGTIWRRM